VDLLLPNLERVQIEDVVEVGKGVVITARTTTEKSECRRSRFWEWTTSLPAAAISTERSCSTWPPVDRLTCYPTAKPPPWPDGSGNTPAFR